jgi:hypothetical protein
MERIDFAEPDPRALSSAAVGTSATPASGVGCHALTTLTLTAGPLAEGHRRRSWLVSSEYSVTVAGGGGIES